MPKHRCILDLGYNMNLGAGDNGNVAAITNYKDSTRSQSFTYDALNRLTSAQNAGTNCSQKTAAGATEYWGNSYGVACPRGDPAKRVSRRDAWGNLLQKTPTKCSAENLSVTALANNQLSGYGYDAAGNMTHDASTGNNYSYDQENRITGAAGYTYIYDADGNRVEKSNGSTGTIYWYMTPGIVAESDLSGNLKSEYVFFDGERVARKDFPSNAVSYYFSDHLKTASVITDSAGNIKEDEDYYPWGGEIQFLNNDSNHYKFTGKERDNETGLDYFGARYYGNWLGRFMSADWAEKPEAVPYSDLHDPQSLNLYSYVRNVPTSRADPDGHEDAIALGAEIGGGIGTLIEPGGGTAVGATIGATVGVAVDVGLGIYAAYKYFTRSNSTNTSPPPSTSTTTQTTTPGTTTTTVQTGTPASTSQAGTVDSTATQAKTVPLSERDEKRYFTPSEAQTLKDRADGRCETCGRKTTQAKPYRKGSKHSPREGQAGHKKAWSKGGRTKLGNGKWQCKGCNQAEGANSK